MGQWHPNSGRDSPSPWPVRLKKAQQPTRSRQKNYGGFFRVIAKWRAEIKGGDQQSEKDGQRKRQPGVQSKLDLPAIRRLKGRRVTCHRKVIYNEKPFPSISFINNLATGSDAGV